MILLKYNRNKEKCECTLYSLEKEREMMFRAFEAKMNDVVEKRDRILTHELNRSLEEKRLEITAAKEIEPSKSWWQKFWK